MTDLSGKRVAFVVNNSGVEEPELTKPWDGLKGMGAETVLAAPKAGEVQAFTNDVEKAGTYEATATIDSLRAEDFDALVIPGGTTNADSLRLEDDAVRFVKDMVAAGKPVAAICHGPWMLVEADVLGGKTLTSYPTLQTDIRNAGGTWVDEQAKTCPANGWLLVTSRNPDDLDAFVAAAGEAFAQGSPSA